MTSRSIVLQKSLFQVWNRPKTCHFFLPCTFFDLEKMGGTSWSLIVSDHAHNTFVYFPATILLSLLRKSFGGGRNNVNVRRQRQQERPRRKSSQTTVIDGDLSSSYFNRPTYLSDTKNFTDSSLIDVNEQLPSKD